MDLSGERLIEARRETVWAALNDPAVLQNCVPFCRSIEKISDAAWKVTASVKLGTATTFFTGTVLRSEIDAPNGYTISFEGEGAEIGPAKGSGKIALLDAGDSTLLSYRATAEAAHNSDQLADSARHMIETFLANLTAGIAPSLAQEPVYHLAHEDHDHDPSNPHYFGLPLGVIIAGVVAVAAVGITLAKFIL